jgi:hypothetical protein
VGQKWRNLATRGSFSTDFPPKIFGLRQGSMLCMIIETLLPKLAEEKIGASDFF